MSTPLAGLPHPLCEAELAQGSVHLDVHGALYPLDALYGAAYVFIDRCYVFLSRASPDKVRVTLSPKKGEKTEEALRDLVGEFSNELLSNAWRHQITEKNRPLIEAVTTGALAGALGPPSLEELANFDFTDTPLEDPLGIAQSWEEKYKKKEKKNEKKSEEEKAP
jgi:His-Xaa-Ser system protein HxsD